MKKLRKIILLICGLGIVTFFAACEDQGPAEKAGEKIDTMVEDTRETIDKAGDKIEEGIEKTGESIEQTGEKMQKQ